MATTIKQLLHAHRRLWYWSGLLAPPGRYAGLYYIYAVFLFTLTMFSHISNWMSMPQAHNMLEINDIALPPIILLLVNIKAIEFMRNRHRIDRVCSTVVELQAQLMPLEGQHAERRIVRQGFVLSAYMAAVSTSCLGAKFIWVLWQRQRTLMFVAVLPFDWQHCNAVLFYVTVTVQWAVGMYASLVISTLDVFGPSMYGVLCTMLELLGERLQRLGRSRAVGPRYETECLAELVECVRLHKKCLGLGDELERIYSIHYTAQLGITAFGLCAVSFSITELDVIADPAHTVHFLSCLLSMTAEILLPCYFGSVLTERSEDLAASVYGSAWPDRGPAFWSTMRVFVERAKRPILLRTYRGFFHINLPTFVSVMRMAYTLLSFCSQLM